MGVITVRHGACLKVENCVFDQASTAIEMSPAAKEVIVENSLFTKCGMESEYSWFSEHACIQINDNQYFDVANGHTRDGHSYSVKLKCIGNTFEDNFSFPIAERAMHPDEE